MEKEKWTLEKKKGHTVRVLTLTRLWLSLLLYNLDSWTWISHSITSQIKASGFWNPNSKQNPLYIFHIFYSISVLLCLTIQTSPDPDPATVTITARRRQINPTVRLRRTPPTPTAPRRHHHHMAKAIPTLRYPLLTLLPTKHLLVIRNHRKINTNPTAEEAAAEEVVATRRRRRIRMETLSRRWCRRRFLRGQIRMW